MRAPAARFAAPRARGCDRAYTSKLASFSSAPTSTRVKLGLHQSARLEQRLVQSPQMIQAMQILQLPAVDLEERIEQELTENPFLEPSEPGAPDEDGSAEGAAERGRLESMLDELERHERDWNGRGRARTAYDDEADKKLEALQNTPAAPRTLAEALIDELSLLDLDERGHELAEYLIYSLDHRGYLAQPLAEIAAECGVEGATEAELAAVLATLRESLHPALGARDLREALLLQLDAHGIEDSLVRAIVDHHLDDVTTNRLPRIAKATGRGMEDVKQALETVRTLEPNPGAGFGDGVAAAILPDVIVEEIDGRYEVRLTRSRMPELRVNHPLYRQLLAQAKKGDGAQEWVKKRIEAARWFIDAIHQRQNTLLKIANKIFEHQRDFLDRGIKALHPLRMQQIADEVGVHISTVSRAVSGKYAQTPRGTHPLKFFFTGGTQKESGEVESQAAIKQRIAELVAQENQAEPLSDDQLAALLEAREKIKIARRTVTKYRKALSIPSSSQRRVF
jgi:RNA polymerase sigma-54 factor